MNNPFYYSLSHNIPNQLCFNEEKKALLRDTGQGVKSGDDLLVSKGPEAVQVISQQESASATCVLTPICDVCPHLPIFYVLIRPFWDLLDSSKHYQRFMYVSSEAVSTYSQVLLQQYSALSPTFLVTVANRTVIQTVLGTLQRKESLLQFMVHRSKIKS